MSIDEHPGAVITFDSLTTDEEVRSVFLETQRRRIPVTHLASNLGSRRVWVSSSRTAWKVSRNECGRSVASVQELGVMVDFRSDDDLSVATRHVIKRATGRTQFKISPTLQLVCAEALGGYHPGLFRRWWDDAVSYAPWEVEAVSAFAAQCVRM